MIDRTAFCSLPALADLLDELRADALDLRQERRATRRSPPACCRRTPPRSAWRSCGPMPLTSPEPRYFAIPSAVCGGVVLISSALNCSPCVRSVTQSPVGARRTRRRSTCWQCPTTVTTSRCPRACTRSTQYPLSRLWNVIRSITPVSCSGIVAPARAIELRKGHVEGTGFPPNVQPRSRSVAVNPCVLLPSCSSTSPRLAFGTYQTFRPTIDSRFVRIQTERGDGMLNHYILEHSWQAVSNPDYRGSLFSPAVLLPRSGHALVLGTPARRRPAVLGAAARVPYDLAYQWWQILLTALNFVAFAAGGAVARRGRTSWRCWAATCGRSRWFTSTRSSTSR